MGAIERVSNDILARLPIYAGAADMKLGAFLKRGVTAGTDFGALIKQSGNNNAPRVIGRLAAPLIYATDNQTLQDGTKFVTKPVNLVSPFRIYRLEFDLTSLITCTQAVSTTTMTVTNLEDDIDASFLYVAAGVGIGQTNYLTAAAAGSCTLKAAFGTSLDTTSKFVKILRRFHELISLNSDGTKIASQDVVGTMKAEIIDIHMKRSGRITQLDPTKHAALTGLNNVAGLKFLADVAIRDAVPTTID